MLRWLGWLRFRGREECGSISKLTRALQHWWIEGPGREMLAHGFGLFVVGADDLQAQALESLALRDNAIVEGHARLSAA